MLGLVSRIRRLRPQFSLRALLLFMLFCALPCGWYARAERQRILVETAFDAESWNYPIFIYDHEFLPSGAMDVAGALHRDKASAFRANLFHRPKVLLAGLGYPIPSRPSRLLNLRDIELFYLVQSAGMERPYHIRWDILGELNSLEQIYLGTSCFCLTGEDLAHFRKFKKLQVLCLSGQPISDEHLVHLESLACLQELYLQQTKVTEAGVSRLQAALPNCRIAWRTKQRGDKLSAL